MAFTITQLTSKLESPIAQALTSTGVTSPIHPLGYQVMSQDGRKYQYIKFDNGNSIAAVAGAPCTVAQSSDPNVITSDMSYGSSVATGMFMSILANGYYGWIQTEGRAVDCPCTDGSSGEVAAGEPLKGTTDGVWTLAVVADDHVKAVARMAGASGYATIELLPK